MLSFNLFKDFINTIDNDKADLKLNFNIIKTFEELYLIIIKLNFNLFKDLIMIKLI